jgi:hypothetical protein
MEQRDFFGFMAFEWYINFGAGLISPLENYGEVENWVSGAFV